MLDFTDRSPGLKLNNSSYNFTEKENNSVISIKERNFVVSVF